MIIKRERESERETQRHRETDTETDRESERIKGNKVKKERNKVARVQRKSELL